MHIALLTAVLAAAPPAAPPASPPAAPATAPALDTRIDPAKVTEQPIPPLPHQVMLPLPPDHRIADEATQVPISAAHWTKARAAIDTGRRALADRQDASGGWMTAATAAPSDAPDRATSVSVAITAMAVKALIQGPADPAYDEPVRRALAYIDTARTDDGSYAGGSLTNYVTASVVSALAAVDDRRLAEDIAASVTWLQTSQWDQSEGLNAAQDWYGGAGYGKHGRPDLSNTQTMLEAIYDAGRSPAEPAFERALTFVARTQNRSSTNPAPWAGDDGGFVYTPAGGGESMASEAAGEGRRGELIAEGSPRSLRSYGSMTYAGFKSMLYAGLSPDDERVRAAFDWIRRHWTFDENPGLGQQGLFYYYHAMSRALRVAQQPTVTDVEGGEHNWREELIDAIVSRQRPDGTWRNASDRWLESEPDLATAYALLALEETLKPMSTHDDAP